MLGLLDIWDDEEMLMHVMGPLLVLGLGLVSEEGTQVERRVMEGGWLGTSETGQTAAHPCPCGL